MGMEGDLASVGVADLLQMLHLGGKSGVLVLSRSLEEVVLGTSRGLLVSVYALRGEGLSVAWTLYLEGLLGADQLRTARSESGQEERWVEALGAGGLCPASLTQSLILKHTSRLLVEVAGWSTGHFVFNEKGPGLQPPGLLTPPLQPTSFWLEVQRRRDEIGSVAAECRSRNIEFEAARGQAGEAKASPRARRLLELMGPHASIDGMFEAFHQARYEALEAARELLRAGLLVPRAGEESVKLERTFWNYVPEEDDEDGQVAFSMFGEPVEEEVEFLTTEEPEPLPAPRSGAAGRGGPAPPRPAAPVAERGAPGIGPVQGDRQRPGVVKTDLALQNRLKALTEGLDEVIPDLAPRERWKRRVLFVAFTVSLLLAALFLLAANLGLLNLGRQP
jgi:uncharacterized protein DUF4388